MKASELLPGDRYSNAAGSYVEIVECEGENGDGDLVFGVRYPDGFGTRVFHPDQEVAYTRPTEQN